MLKIIELTLHAFELIPHALELTSRPIITKTHYPMAPPFITVRNYPPIVGLWVTLIIVVALHSHLVTWVFLKISKIHWDINTILVFQFSDSKSYVEPCKQN